MKRIGFILFCSVLLFCSCQENLNDVPDQNMSEGKARLWMIKTLDGMPQTKAVSVKDKQWTKGDTIRIKFLTGSGYTIALENAVKQYAAIWLQYATSLHFEYVAENENADVKVGFDMDERWLTWSTIGKDCQSISQDEPSINFYNLGSYTNDIDIQGDVLRGFGHILGLVFEHQTPDSPIQFNSNARKLLTLNYSLSNEDVDKLMFFYNSTQTNSSEYDPSSIMVFAIYGSMLVDKTQATPAFNTTLSAQDIKWAQTQYKSQTPAVDINIQALNTYLATQQGEWYCSLFGINYDGDEKLPFIVSNESQDCRYGYVSNGIVYERKSPYWHFSTRSASLCFIFQNELYVSTMISPMEEFKIYSLQNLEERFYCSGTFKQYQKARLPYVYEGKKYITGGGMIENKMISLEVYCLENYQKNVYTLEFPSEKNSGTLEMMFIKNDFIYCMFHDWDSRIPVDIYKIKLGTFDSVIPIATINGIGGGNVLTSNTNGNYYVSAQVWFKMLIFDSNDNIELKNTPDNSYVLGYHNKLYKAYMRPTIPYYQEFALE